MKKTEYKGAMLKLLPPLLSVAVGIFLGWYILFITRPVDSLPGIGIVLAGGFLHGIHGLGALFYTATPIILTGLAVGFSIKTGLFNIGASGQFTVGAFAAILIGIKAGSLAFPLPCILAIAGGILAGALWGFFVGVLKAFFEVNEIISGIMFNYIGMLLVNLLIRTFVYDSAHNCNMDIPESAQLSRTFFEQFLPDSRLNAGFLIVLAIVFLVQFLLSRTTFGYELKIVGKNRFAGIYAGINDKRSILFAMMISGALAGAGGALLYLSDFGEHIYVVENVLQQGFTGISVALLGMNHPIGILFSGLFIAHITVGGNYLQLYGYTPDLVDMIIAIIVYCGALALPLRMLVERFAEKKQQMKSSAVSISAEKEGKA